MKKKELIKIMQTEFDDGETLSNIYEKYKGSGFSEKKFARLVGCLKDKKLIIKHTIANRFLIAFIILITFIETITHFIIGINPVVLFVSIVITVIFIYYFIKVTYLAYLTYFFLSLLGLQSSLRDFGTNLVFDIIGIGFSIFLMALLWYLKSKLFPYIGAFGVKKDSNGQYLFITNKK